MDIRAGSHSWRYVYCLRPSILPTDLSVGNFYGSTFKKRYLLFKKSISEVIPSTVNLSADINICRPGRFDPYMNCSRSGILLYLYLYLICDNFILQIRIQITRSDLILYLPTPQLNFHEAPVVYASPPLLCVWEKTRHAAV